MLPSTRCTHNQPLTHLQDRSTSYAAAVVSISVLYAVADTNFGPGQLVSSTAASRGEGVGVGDGEAVTDAVHVEGVHELTAARKPVLVNDWSDTNWA